MKSLIRLLLLVLPLAAAAQLPAFFYDNEGRSAVVEIRGRLSTVRATLLSSDFDPSKATFAHQSFDDIANSLPSGGDQGARNEILNLRQSLIVLERAVGLKVVPFALVETNNKSIFIPGSEDKALRLAILNLRDEINQLRRTLVARQPTAEAEAAKRRQQELEQRLAAERERERQTAEAEAARRKQQELEQRLATEALEREKQAAEADAARLRQKELEQRLAAERERERQTAEAEAARRKQQELEQRLATEAREREKQAAEVEAVRRRQQELEAQLAALQSQAASRPPNQAASSRNQRRIALVIGNAAYKVSPLDNPVNDATDIDRTLKQLGFQTTLLRNATLGQMREATRRFADQLQSADVALIYFAGHGVESNRKNYMIPVNADLKFEYELDDQAYNASQWLDMLESIKSSNAERVNIVILDACRNNALIGARSLGRGLGRMDAPTGTFLAYSTAPGKVAADGTGNRNSPFTRHLLTAMQQPGLPIEEAFKEVRRNVSRETNGAQVPWESTSLTGFFTFRQTR